MIKMLYLCSFINIIFHAKIFYEHELELLMDLLA